MSTIIPNGSVTFYEDVEPDMFFFSESERNTYYNSKKKVVIAESNYSYINHMDGAIRVDMNYAETSNLWACNFLSFTSSGEAWSNSERRYYCKIEDYERLNNGCVEIYFAIDWLQTDMFEYKISYAQVERETSPVGTFLTGDSNTLYTSEGLSIAEPIQYRTLQPFTYSSTTNEYSQTMERGDSAFLNFGNAYRAVLLAIENELGVTYDPTGTIDGKVSAGFFDVDELVTTYTQPGVQTPVQYAMGGVSMAPTTLNVWYQQYLSLGNYPAPYYVAIKKTDRNGMEELQNILNNYASREMTSSILGLYYLPKFIYAPRVKNGQLDLNSLGETITIHTPYTLANLQSSKLNVSPYSYLRVISFDGSEKLYSIELFSDPSNIQFLLTGTFLGGVPVATLVPLNYNGFAVNFRERLSLPAFPQLAYTIDGSIVYQSAINQSLIENNGSASQQSLIRAQAKGQYAEANVSETGLFTNAVQPSNKMVSDIRNSLINKGIDPSTTVWGNSIDVGTGIENIRGYMKYGTPENMRAQADIMRKNANNALTGLSTARTLQNARARGASWDSPAFNSSFLADNAMMQDFYVPASGDITPFVCGYDGLRFDFVTLREGLREQYTKYFNMFGYTNGSIRMPALSHNGGTTSQGDNNATSCFHSDPFNNNYVQGYTRCNSINIYGVSSTSADYIKTRFQSGIVWHREA